MLLLTWVWMCCDVTVNMYEIRPEAILRGRQRDVKSERIDIWVTLTGVGLKYSTVASDPLQVHFMQLTPTRDNKT